MLINPHLFTVKRGASGAQRFTELVCVLEGHKELSHLTSYTSQPIHFHSVALYLSLITTLRLMASLDYAYLKRGTIRVFETKQPLLWVICPQGSLSPLPKTQALLNFLCFFSPARDALPDLPPRIREPFHAWCFLSLQVLGHRNQISSHLSPSLERSLFPCCLFSLALLSFCGSVLCLPCFSRQGIKRPGAGFLCGSLNLGMLQPLTSAQGTCCTNSSMFAK